MPTKPSKTDASLSSNAGSTASAASLSATSSLFPLPPGLYVVRILERHPGQRLNPVSISRAPGGQATVEFLAPPSVVQNTLVELTDCLVIRVGGEAAMLMATEFHAGPAVEVRLRIERLDGPQESSAAAPVSTQLQQRGQRPAAQGQASQRQVAQRQAAQRQTAQKPQATRASIQTRQDLEDEVSVHMVGHVQGVGDMVAQDDWLGDPEGNERLEGFAIRAQGLPEGVRLVYGCKFMSPELKSQVTNDGKYVGTRRKAKALRSLVFGLEGSGSELYDVAGAVAFSGQAIRPIEAATELHGPTGKEYVVALNLQIVPKTLANGDNGGSGDDEDGYDSELEYEELEVSTEGSEGGTNDADTDSGNGDDGFWSDEDISKLFSR